nr:heat shock protein 70G [Dunaliella salina]
MRSTMLLATAVIMFLANAANASMMSVDLGSEYLKVALIKPGRTPISIVVNEMTRRKSPALVGVVNGERLLGEEAFSLSVRYPDSIYTRIRDLLGKPASDPSLHRMLQAQSLPFRVVPHSPERPTAAVQGKDGSVHSAEELVASLLQYAQGIAEAQSGAPVPDAVVAVPPFFGQAQRQALQDAAQLAGINLMGIINSNTAAALQFGIEKDFADKTQHVIFYDLGSGSTIASLVKYSSYEAKEAGKPKAISQLEVKEVEWDEQCGSNNLDALLAQHFAADFAAKHGFKAEEVLGNPRTMAKMRKQIRRTKEVLSANTAAPVSVEELHEGIDYQASITREQFETLAGPFFEQAARPLKAVLDRSGLKIEEIHQVEILGGGSRIPRVQAMLQEALKGRVLDKHMDADESVVLGASLFAANLSTSFRLRKFGMTDAAMYGMSLRFDELHKQPQQDKGAAAPAPEADAEEKVRNLLPYMKKLPVRRLIHFNNLTQDPIRMSLLYNDSTPHGLPPATDPQSSAIGTFEVSGINTVINKYNNSGVVNLRFEAGIDGVLQFERAEAVVQYTVLEEKIKYLKPPNGTDNNNNSSSSSGAGAGAEEGNTKAEGEATSGEEGASDDGSTENTEGGEAPAEEAAGEEAPQEEETQGRKMEEAEGAAAPDAGASDAGKNVERIMVPRTKTAKVRLNITSSWTHPLLVGETLAKAQAAVSSWLALEKAKRDNAAAKNDLEAYIIKTRGTFMDADKKLLKVTTEE